MERLIVCSLSGQCDRTALLFFRVCFRYRCVFFSLFLLSADERRSSAFQIHIHQSIFSYPIRFLLIRRYFMVIFFFFLNKFMKMYQKKYRKQKQTTKSIVRCTGAVPNQPNYRIYAKNPSEKTKYDSMNIWINLTTHTYARARTVEHRTSLTEITFESGRMCWMISPF